MHPEIAPIAPTLPTLDLEDVAAARAFMAQLTGRPPRARHGSLNLSAQARGTTVMKRWSSNDPAT
jgi:hypothetical protein